MFYFWRSQILCAKQKSSILKKNARLSAQNFFVKLEREELELDKNKFD